MPRMLGGALVVMLVALSSSACSSSGASTAAHRAAHGQTFGVTGSIAAVVPDGWSTCSNLFLFSGTDCGWLGSNSLPKGSASVQLEDPTMCSTGAAGGPQPPANVTAHLTAQGASNVVVHADDEPGISGMVIGFCSGDISYQLRLFGNTERDVTTHLDKLWSVAATVTLGSRAASGTADPKPTRALPVPLVRAVTAAGKATGTALAPGSGGGGLGYKVTTADGSTASLTWTGWPSHGTKLVCSYQSVAGPVDGRAAAAPWLAECAASVFTPSGAQRVTSFVTTTLTGRRAQDGTTSTIDGLYVQARTIGLSLLATVSTTKP